MRPLFSIIIPVYNIASYLRECLDSVLAQTCADWEAICVDDGSTDGSGAILDEYGGRDKRFRIIHQENAGVSAARNLALDLAMGEWLSFVDADDVLAENALTKLIEAAKATNSDLAIGGVLRFGGEKGEVLVGPQSDGMFSPESLYVKYNALCAWSWGKIYKRSLWEGMKFPVGIAYSEDRYILHRILYAFPLVPFVAEPLYRYRSRPGSAYGSNWNRGMAAQRHLALEEQIRFFHDNGFANAELFTAGLYFKDVSKDVINLAKTGQVDSELHDRLTARLRELEHVYWPGFVKSCREGHWKEFPSCGLLRTILDLAVSGQSVVSPFRRFMNVLRYDGVRAVGAKLLRRTLMPARRVEQRNCL